MSAMLSCPDSPLQARNRPWLTILLKQSFHALMRMAHHSPWPRSHNAERPTHRRFSYICQPCYPIRMSDLPRNYHPTPAKVSRCIIKGCNLGFCKPLNLLETEMRFFSFGQWSKRSSHPASAPCHEACPDAPFQLGARPMLRRSKCAALPPFESY